MQAPNKYAKGGQWHGVGTPNAATPKKTRAQKRAARINKLQGWHRPERPGECVVYYRPPAPL